MRNTILLIILFSIYFIKEAWTLLPYDNTEYKLYWLSDMAVTKEYYWGTACTYLVWCVLIYIIHQLWESCRDIVKWFLIFQILEFIEYFITYNDPAVLGFSVMYVKCVTMFAMITYKIWKIS